MRELKFRAWDKWKNEYIYNGIEYALRMIEIEHEYKDIPPIGFVEEVDGRRFDVEQSTGLHDKNGNEDYHHDLVSICVGNTKYIREIKRAQSGAWVVSVPAMDSNGKVDIILFTIEHENVGNIHENPELLK